MKRKKIIIQGKELKPVKQKSVHYDEGQPLCKIINAINNNVPFEEILKIEGIVKPKVFKD